MRAASRTPAAAASLASVLVVFTAGCAVLPPSPVPSPGPVLPQSRTVTCITRTLADGLHMQVLEHRMRVVAPALVAFLDAHPALDGHLTLQDLLFLERLAESNHRDALRESASRAADQSDRMDPVERIKIGLIRAALRFPVFLEAIAGALEDDAVDPSSEHGGLVVLETGEGCPLRLLAVPSSIVGDDTGYWLPPELFTAAALAFWHDHPLRAGEGVAGPSGAIGPSLVTSWGDRWIAYLRGIDGLVFTPTGGGGFSVAFFNAEGETFDLGRFAPR